MFLYGKNSVYARLQRNPQTIKRVFLKKDFSHPSIEGLLVSHRIRVFNLNLSVIKRIGSDKNLQGIVAEVEDFKHSSLEELLKGRGMTLLFLDRIFDPQNLGAIIRVSACFGGVGIVIPKYKSCPITETVLHIAQGGENYVPIALVSNLVNAILEAKREGFWIVGAVVLPQAKRIDDFSFSFPLGLVLGSEAKGIRYGIEKYLDEKLYIPMAQEGLSLNVVGACTIFLYEIKKHLRLWKGR